MRSLERRFKRAAIRVIGGLASGRKLDITSVDPDSIKRILLVKQHDQLGDFLLFTPVISAVRQRFPDARIIVCTRGYTKELAMTDPLIDGVIAIEERLDHWRIGGLRDAIVHILRGFDLAIVFNTISHSFTSDLVPLLGRARYRLGPTTPHFPDMNCNPFYNLEVSLPQDAVHMSDKCLAIATPLGVSIDDSRERMHIDSCWDREASQVLTSWGVEGDGPFLAMHPGGARDYTRWPMERYAALGDRLSSINGARVMVIVGKNENWGEEVSSQMKSEHIVCRISNIKLLAAVFKRLAVYVGNDTGLLHVACAVGTRSVGIYGSTEPEIWKPKGSHVVSVKAKDDNITSVSVDEVYSAVVGLMR